LQQQFVAAACSQPMLCSSVRMCVLKASFITCSVLSGHVCT
jgi:hypothetical protein